MQRDDTFWTDPAEIEDLDLVDVELKTFLASGQSAKAYRLDDPGARLASQIITVYAAPGIVGFGIGADNLDPTGMLGLRGEQGQVLWHPRRLRYEIMHMALYNAPCEGNLAATLACADSSVPVAPVYSGPNFSAYNSYNRCGTSGAPCFLFPNVAAAGPTDVLFTVQDVVPTPQTVLNAVGFNASDGAWTYSTVQIYSAAVGATAGPTEYIACAPAPNDLQRDDTTASVTSLSPAPSVWGQSVTIVANVAHASGVAAPSGYVQFSTFGVALGSALLDSSSNATLVTSLLPIGTNTVTAEYLGDSSYNPSSATQSATVDAAATATALSIAPSSATYGQTVTLGATVSVTTPGSGTGAGTVTFKDGTTVLAVVPLSAGYGFFQTTFLGAGAHSLSAAFNPDPGGFSGGPETTTSTGTGAITIAKAPLTVSVQSASMTYGAAVPGFAPTFAGLVNGDSYLLAVTGSPTFTTSATPASGIGSYAVTVAAGTLAAANYDFSVFTPGTLMIGAQPLYVSAVNGSMRHGDDVPAMTASTSGAVNGDVLTTSCVTDATSYSPPGTYAISPSVTGANVANYSVTYQQGVMTVT